MRGHGALRSVALTLLLLSPWLAFASLAGAAWWFIEFDGRRGNEDLGWILLALALPALFAAAHVSRLERRWIKARFYANATVHESAGAGGILGRLLDWP